MKERLFFTLVVGFIFFWCWHKCIWLGFSKLISNRTLRHVKIMCSSVDAIKIPSMMHVVRHPLPPIFVDLDSLTMAWKRTNLCWSWEFRDRSADGVEEQSPLSTCVFPLIKIKTATVKSILTFMNFYVVWVFFWEMSLFLWKNSCDLGSKQQHCWCCKNCVSLLPLLIPLHPFNHQFLWLLFFDILMLHFPSPFLTPRAP